MINGPYTNAGGFSYLTQTFNLSGSTNTILRFYSWNNSFGNFDYGQIAVNGTLVWGPQWDTAPYSWQERVVDLSAYDGLSEVTIQFQHYTTTVVAYSGWYIDDIYIGPNNATRAAQQNFNIVNPVYPKASASEIEQQIALENSVRANPTSYMHPVRTATNSRMALGRVPVGYKVWRLNEGQETNEAAWTSLTANAITDTFYVDPGWQSFPDGHYKWAVKTFYTGGVVSVPRFTNILRKRPNDLSALSIAGNATPTVGTPSDYVVRIKNTGTSAQAAGAYTVKVMSGTNELASIPGPAIAVNQELDVSVPWSPTTEGSTTIFGKVVLPADTVPDNDISPSITVLVLPSGIWAVTVGDGSQNARIPVDMYYKCSLYQSLYFPNEMGNFLGMITGIQFYNAFTTATLQNMPTKVYLGTTTQTDLSTDWIPATNMTLVFDGTVNYPAGENLITIPFAQPYMYLNGENLIMMVLRPMDTAYYSSADNFKAQTEGTNRARKAYSDTIVYDPMAPPAPVASQLSGQFPKTTFLVIPGGVGHLTGTVTTTGDQPLEGVSVTISETSYQATTNASGQFQIQNILPNTYTLNLAKYGYVSHTQQITIVEDETTNVNVVMDPMATVNVTGTIIAS
ncbi:MAG TPA: carboxypeptidase-like regulatory domain-containing protein, partial [Candidatus Cloacimonadota bacterium]|nr:carboxypeptidase-like regulatory domain-containing protein [Candidatus Cloacimonadota bacterium]